VALLYLVRHAQADAGWSEDPDPGLSKLGIAQAAATAHQLAPRGPLPIITSPLRRARQTAAALERHWNTLAIVEPGVGEVPSPSEDLAERQDWLQRALASTWPDLGPRYTSWRTMVTSLLGGLTHDTVVVTHFVAINAAIGAATGDDRVLCRSVGNASVTVLESGGHELALADESLTGVGSDGTISTLGSTGEVADPAPVL
jgi:broad specificity phosphatase PhoE